MIKARAKTGGGGGGAGGGGGGGGGGSSVDTKMDTKSPGTNSSSAAAASGSSTHGRGADEQLWVDKYAPTSLDMLIGNKGIAQRLVTWLTNWYTPSLLVLGVWLFSLTSYVFVLLLLFSFKQETGSENGPENALYADWWCTGNGQIHGCSIGCSVRRWPPLPRIESKQRGLIAWCDGLMISGKRVIRSSN